MKRPLLCLLTLSSLLLALLLRPETVCFLLGWVGLPCLLGLPALVEWLDSEEVSS